jgi:NADPH:quinone reductase-like Zn-dependent oxidoreductase
MKAYEIGLQDGLQSLRLAEHPDPIAGPGEAVLRVRAVCLNHRDILVLQGTYGPRRPETRVPVSDGIGEVIAVGAGVAGIKVGERATCAHFASWIDGAFSMSAFSHDLGISHDGWLAEKIVVPAAALVRIPDVLSDEQVVALPAAGVTAWNALVEFAKIRAGETVLTLGTGGVSIFALQIAKLCGARVVITSSSDEKLDKTRKLGADITINYRNTPDWPAALMAQTGGTGADIIVETGGFASLGQSIAAASANARIALIGALGGPPSAGLPNFSTIIGKNLTLRGITEGSRAMLASLLGAVEVSGLTPVIDRVFAFDKACEAYAYLKSGEHLGKVMIRL